MLCTKTSKTVKEVMVATLPDVLTFLHLLLDPGEGATVDAGS